MVQSLCVFPESWSPCVTASGYHCLVSRKLRLVDSKELEVNNEGDVVVEENSGEVKEEWKSDNRKQTKVQDNIRKKMSA